MKQTLQHIKKYFTIWWIPIATNILAIGIFFLGTLFKRDWIIDASLIVFFVNIIGTIISSIVQIVIRKWYFIFPQLGLGAFLFYYTVIIFTGRGITSLNPAFGWGWMPWLPHIPE
jgi:hypothetical protein